MIDLSAINSLLITGVNGFVGRSVINQIAKIESNCLPIKLVLVTRNGLDFDLPTNLRPITTVINHDLTCEWEFDVGVSHIINLAADGNKSPYSESSNRTFTLIVSNLLSWVSKHESSLRLFHASSGACSGYLPLIHSSAINNPKINFAQNRLEAESALKKGSNDLGFELTIGRLFTFSGVYILGRSQYAIADFIKSAIAKSSIRVSGDRNTVRSYLHQDEMALWILKALICKEPYADLEIGSSEAVTINELAKFIAQETSSSISFSTVNNHGDIYLPNNQETKIRLGVTEVKSWREAVVEMIEFERQKLYGSS